MRKRMTPRQIRYTPPSSRSRAEVSPRQPPMVPTNRSVRLSAGRLWTFRPLATSRWLCREAMGVAPVTASEAESTPVVAAMPGFSLEFEDELSEALAVMGMPDAFSASLADFSGMGYSDVGNLYINRVLHKAFIDVTPLGTRAGAATVVEMGDSAAAPAEEPPAVLLDRPFLFMIADTEYNIPLFIGAVTGETF